MALSEAEELELLTLERERSKGNSSRMFEDAMRISRAFLQGGPIGAAAQGVGTAFQGLDELSQKAGGATVDALTNIGASPEVAAGAGTAVQMIPNAISGGVAAPAGAVAMDMGAKRLMQSALKPTSKSLANGDAARAIETMLREGVNATQGGAVALREMITKLKGEVGAAIAQSQGTVNKGYVFSELAKTLDDVTKQGLPNASREAVLAAWKEFKNHPLLRYVNDIPVQQADEIKRATQQAGKEFYRRTPNQATAPGADKANAAVASGLRQGIEDAVPGVAEKNAKLSEYINALHQIEPRAAMAANRDLAGLAPLANTPEIAMAMLADRNPWMKSLVARVLHEGRTAAPAAGGAVGFESVRE